jgi:hypothetical protein
MINNFSMHSVWQRLAMFFHKPLMVVLANKSALQPWWWQIMAAHFCN